MADDAPDVVQAVREILRQYPDDGTRVLCPTPTCGGLLAEYQYGVTRYTCRHCKWVGMIERTGGAADQRVTTVRPGKPRPRREDGKED